MSTKAVKAKKNSTKAAEAVAANSKQNAETTAQPGIIAEIVTTLKKAKENGKPVTSKQILDHLAKKFPDREASGMMITVRAQLSRLPREKDLKIKKHREGRVVTYAAA
jgi:hypothetical protein